MLQHGNISLKENPIETPPPEIVKQGKQAIRAYFRSLEDQETVTLNEVKILLVGEGMAGKTSVLKRLQGIAFDPNESQTHGINVISFPANQLPGLPQNSSLKECLLHCWDFGGQEIMHASHQFFLSERALYILVIDSRTDDKKYHWLKHIEKFGGDSPLVVVMNKIDLNAGYNVEQKRINDTFPTIQNRFVRLSCRTDEGLPALVRYIAQAIPHTSLFGSQISAAWMQIKETLVAETAASRYISRERFQTICRDNDVHDQSSQLTLLKYLHDLGVVLYFEQLNLSNIYVLDPHWVTIGVYKIINSQRITNGLLKERDLNYILNEEQIKKDEYDPARKKAITYTREEQRYILDIMMQFELCYEYNKQKRQYIVPNLLPKEIDHEPELDQGTPLRFIMKYDYLPSSIIPRTMLRFKNDIENGQQWRFGMILSNSRYQCRAKIKSDEIEKSITITVQGEDHRKREYFSAIRHCILDISHDFENLVIQELIPLPGYPHAFVEYQVLLGFEKASRDEYFDGKLGQTFPVSQLLDSVISRAEREMEKSTLRAGLQGDKPQTINIDRYYAGGHHEGDDIDIRDISHAAGIAVGKRSKAKGKVDPSPAQPVLATPLTLTQAEREELDKLTQQKASIERPIHTQARIAKYLYVLSVVAVSAIVYVVLDIVVNYFGWDVLEPYTWIGSMVTLAAAPLLVWYSPEKFSPRAIETKLFDHLWQRSYPKFGFDPARFNQLSSRAEET
ncbi:MAG: hypothetical protein KC421_30655 [Anaerolineales bacterium]|nr:hypothetical protein [Anaerolineales bacterium]